MDEIRKPAVQKGYRHDLFNGNELPSIDAFMRNIKDEVDASWFTVDPGAETNPHAVHSAGGLDAGERSTTPSFFTRTVRPVKI